MNNVFTKEFYEALNEYRKVEEPVNNSTNKCNCSNSYKLKNNADEIVCSLCGAVYDDFLVDIETMKFTGHYSFSKIVQYDRKSYFNKRLRYFKGHQNVRMSSTSLMKAMHIANLINNESHLEKVFKSFGLNNQIKNIPWLLALNRDMKDPLESCVRKVYIEIIRVYNDFKVNKKKFIPFHLVIKFICKMLSISVPSLSDDALKIYEKLPHYKNQANEKRNIEVLVKCVESSNLVFLEQDIMQYIAIYKNTFNDETSKAFDVGSLDPGRAIAETARKDSIHDDVLYTPLNEAARQTAIAIDTDLAERFIGHENKQKELAVEGIASIDPKAPVTYLKQPEDPISLILPKAGVGMVHQSIAPEELIPANSAQNIELSKLKIMTMKQQLQKHNTVMNVARGMILANQSK